MSTVTFADIEAAAARIAGHAVRTPLVESPALNARLGARVLLKPETLQHAGAFKFRGAMNKISQLSEAKRARGVVACSSGNHAQGVALVARMLGAPAVIVMPADAPACCSVSGLSRTRAPRCAFRAGLSTSGVLTAWPAIRAAAASMSAKVTVLMRLS